MAREGFERFENEPANGTYPMRRLPTVTPGGKTSADHSAIQTCADDYLERAEEQQNRKLSRCKCMFLAVLCLFSILFFIYAINGFAKLKTSNTHRYFGPQFQSGWSLNNVSVADAVLVAVTVVPLGKLSDEQLEALTTPYMSPLTTPTSRMIITQAPTIDPEYYTDTAIQFTSAACVNTGKSGLSPLYSIPPSASPLAAPVLSLEPKLSGHALVIGADGLPVFTAAANPFALYVFRCIDLKCTAYQPARLVITVQDPHTQAEQATAGADMGLLASAASILREGARVTAELWRGVAPMSPALRQHEHGDGDGSSQPLEHKSQPQQRAEVAADTAGAMDVAATSLPLFPQMRLAISRTGMPLIVAVRPNNELYLYRCSTYNCRGDTNATMLASNAVSYSPGVLIAPNGNLLIAYSDALTHAPVLMACADAQCSSASKTVLSGVVVGSTARLHLHATVSGEVLISFAGRWAGAAASTSSFVSASISAEQSKSFFTALQQRGLLSNKGVVTPTFTEAADVSFLFEGMNETPEVLAWMRAQVVGAMVMLRGAPPEFTNTSERQVIVIHCRVPACSIGNASVRVPWTTAANVTDVAAVLSTRGQSTYFAVHRTSSELWGNTHAVTSWTCPYPDCSNDGAAIGGAHAPHAVVTDMSSATSRIVARAHPHSAAHTLLMVDHDAVPRVLRCRDDDCTRVTAHPFPHGAAVCTASTCFDARVSSVDGMPVLAMGSNLHVAHCGNPFCTPYVTY